jgi:hypothetical protein
MAASNGKVTHTTNGPLPSPPPYVGGVSFNAVKPLSGEVERELSVTEVGKQPWANEPSAIRGTVARHGEKKGNKGVAWGDSIGETSNGNMKAFV